MAKARKRYSRAQLEADAKAADRPVYRSDYDTEDSRLIDRYRGIGSEEGATSEVARLFDSLTD